ncbi:MAG TPA: ATP-binding protein [Ramlibacter sp.]|uniref:sensor histidine kinase n=1 Tax=Ramlibacter sp. TaxID=1917967 RepID=UPI002ED6B0C5
MTDTGDPDDFEQVRALRRSGRRWLALLVGSMLLLLALAWIGFVQQTHYERRQTLEAVAARDGNLATAVMHYAVRVFRLSGAVGTYLEGAYRSGVSEDVFLELLLDRLRANEIFVEMAACLDDGRILSTRLAQGTLTAEDCARLAKDGQELTMALPQRGAGLLLVPFTLPLQGAPGRPGGLLVAMTPVTRLLGVMDEASLQEETTAVIVGRDGQPRAAWHSGQGVLTEIAPMEALAPLLQGRPDPVLQGRAQLVSERGAPGGELNVLVATARDDALAEFHRRRTVGLLACGLLSLGMIAVTLVLARMQARATRQAASLARARGRLQALNSGLDEQVRQRTVELEQAYRDLETFSYTIAHDVRAPLAAIGTYAEELEPAVAAGGTERHQRYLQRIRANAAQMDTLTRHLLDLGRLTRAPLQFTTLDLAAMAREILAGLQECDPLRPVQWEVQDGLAVRGDPALLRQVLENLLGNAWKFSAGRDPARISVSASEERGAPGWNVFTVRDNGAGFDSSTATGLFQPFRRMHSSDEFPGTGVGLATVQRIVALHGGKIWCEAREGEGAAFFFTLPAAEAAG